MCKLCVWQQFSICIYTCVCLHTNIFSPCRLPCLYTVACAFWPKIFQHYQQYKYVCMHVHAQNMRNSAVLVVVEWLSPSSRWCYRRLVISITADVVLAFNKQLRHLHGQIRVSASAGLTSCSGGSAPNTHTLVKARSNIHCLYECVA